MSNNPISVEPSATQPFTGLASFEVAAIGEAVEGVALKGVKPAQLRSSSPDSLGPRSVATQAVGYLYSLLVTAAEYPEVSQELSSEFLAGVDPAALSDIEKAALRVEAAAHARLSALLEHVSVAITARKSKVLLKEQALYSLLGGAAGHRSFAEVHGQRTGKGTWAAVKEVELAQTLRDNPAVQVALEEGRITPEHVGVIVQATKVHMRNGAQELTAQENEDLVEIAMNRDADQFGKDAARLLNSLNPLAADAGLEEQKRRRFLSVAYGSNGAHLRGFLDEMSAHTLRMALAAASPKPAKNDDRTLEQRNADALTGIAKLSLDSGAHKSGANVLPHLSFVMTESTFLQASKEMRRRRLVKAYELRGARPAPAGYNGRTPVVERGGMDIEQRSTAQNSDALPGDVTLGSETQSTEPFDHASLAREVQESGASEAELLDPTLLARDAYESGASDVELFDPALLTPFGVPPAEFDDGTPIPLNELSRLLCDCMITRVVLDAQGLATNLGRTERLYTKEHRRAVIARDKQCRFEGCSMIPERCETHHIEYWDRDLGDTSLENAVLACPFHHHQIHNEVLEVIRDEFGLPQIVVTGKHTAGHMGKRADRNRGNRADKINDTRVDIHAVRREENRDDNRDVKSDGKCEDNRGGKGVDRGRVDSVGARPTVSARPRESAALDQAEASSLPSSTVGVGAERVRSPLPPRNRRLSGNQSLGHETVTGKRPKNGRTPALNAAAGLSPDLFDSVAEPPG